MSNVSVMQPQTKTASQGSILQVHSLAELSEFANILAESQFVPNNFKKKPGDIIAAVQFGSELGLPPMQSLMGAAVINGKPQLYGQIALGVIQAHPEFEDMVDVERTAERAVVEMRRRGRSPVTREFTVAEATQAKLMSKDTYQMYSTDMLWWRAVHRCITALFPDVAAGIAPISEPEVLREREVAGSAQTSGPAAATTQSERLKQTLQEGAEISQAPSLEEAISLIGEPATSEELAGVKPKLVNMEGDARTAASAAYKSRMAALKAAEKKAKGETPPPTPVSAEGKLHSTILDQLDNAKVNADLSGVMDKIGELPEGVLQEELAARAARMMKELPEGKE